MHYYRTILSSCQRGRDIDWKTEEKHISENTVKDFFFIGLPISKIPNGHSRYSMKNTIVY